MMSQIMFHVQWGFIHLVMCFAGVIVLWRWLRKYDPSEHGAALFLVLVAALIVECLQWRTGGVALWDTMVDIGLDIAGIVLGVLFVRGLR